MNPQRKQVKAPAPTIKPINERLMRMCVAKTLEKVKAARKTRSLTDEDMQLVVKVALMAYQKLSNR